MLYHRDARLAVELLRQLRAESGLVIGDNEPYAVGDDTDYTIPVHGEQRGILHVGIELRQDLSPPRPARQSGRNDWHGHSFQLPAVEMPGANSTRLRADLPVRATDSYDSESERPLHAGGDLVRADHMMTDPWVPLTLYRDGFGNWCTRLVAPAGQIRITSDAIITDRGTPDPVVPGAPQLTVETLPEETLVYLIGSRYCDTDNLSQIAWQLFGHTTPGWPRVQAVCDFVHGHLQFGYQYARSTRTASEAYHERQGVCRDFAHLAVTLCRCLNIPARYLRAISATSAFRRSTPLWTSPAGSRLLLEALVHVRCATQCAAHWASADCPRTDAADVAISMTFGPTVLSLFKVWTDEIKPNQL